MRASHRICETCVYCSLAGNCDRYDKPLNSVEQPACDAYEIHPLLAENDKLRELARAAWRCIHTGASCSDCRLIAGGCTLQSAMRELGVEVDA